MLKQNLGASVTCLLRSLRGAGSCSAGCRHYLRVPAALRSVTGLIHTNYEATAVRKGLFMKTKIFLVHT